MFMASDDTINIYNRFWAQIAIAGPNSRKIISKIVDSEFDITNKKFPFMSCKNISVCRGIPARL